MRDTNQYNSHIIEINFIAQNCFQDFISSSGRIPRTALHYGGEDRRRRHCMIEPPRLDFDDNTKYLF